MTLRELLAGIADLSSGGRVSLLGAQGATNEASLEASFESVDLDAQIADLTLDSRAVRQGGVFLAVPGAKVHGVQHAASALARGARAVLWEPMVALSQPALARDSRLIEIPNLSVLVGALADRFYGEPSASLRVAGITGTNGKTTCAYLLAEAMTAIRQRVGAAGKSAAYMGTLGYGPLSALQPATHTTPDCATAHRLLAEFVAEGCGHVGMEVSSHALDQNRVANVRFDTAVFTNLTRDHLDYHGTEDAYAAAKARLFAWPHLRHAVINVGDAHGRQLFEVARTRGTVTAYNVHGPIDAVSAVRTLWADSVTPQADGIEIALNGSWGRHVLRSPLIGTFNAENLLAVAAVLLGWDVPMESVLAALSVSRAPPGRMEVYRATDDRVLVIDYAHTPDALAKALHALRQHRSGRIVCVFGCGGDRDAGKRPLMGHAAEAGADLVILTDDNPRSEAPEAIVADIKRGMRRAADVYVEHDRARAIQQALDSAKPGDAVLIAGKGHEAVQIAGGEVRAFSDRAVVRRLLAERSAADTSATQDSAEGRS